MEEIGRRLRLLRKGKGMTQQDVASRLGMVRATVSNYEVGRRTPHLSELRRFAELFGVDLGYFGVDASEGMFELASRARAVFGDPSIPRREKERLYRDLTRLYLDLDDGEEGRDAK